MRHTFLIGAGHNGLVTAAYLARAGWKVLVLERRHVVGGACVTEEIWPGYRVSTAAYLVSLLQERIVRDLELRRFGYDVQPKDPAYFAPYLDGRHLFMYADQRRTCDEIAKFSSRDAQRYPAYEQFIREYGLSGGNIFHGDLRLDQLFALRPVAGWARYATPIRGLFLCGSGTHPGGGVTGAPGYNAARVILSSRPQ